MAKIKKRLTQHEEFEIMKIVLDKFLWLGLGVLLIGLYQVYTVSFMSGVGWLGSGILIFIIFLALILKEYERIK